MPNTLDSNRSKGEIGQDEEEEPSDFEVQNESNEKKRKLLEWLKLILQMAITIVRLVTF